MHPFIRIQTAIVCLCLACATCTRNPLPEEAAHELQVTEFTRIDTGALVNEVTRGRGLYPVDLDGDHDLDL